MSSVNWDKLGNDTLTQIQHWTANADITNAHSLFRTLGNTSKRIPNVAKSNIVLNRPKTPINFLINLISHRLGFSIVSTSTLSVAIVISGRIS